MGSTVELPALLSNMHAATHKSTDPAVGRLRKELDAVRNVIQHVQGLDPHAQALAQLENLQKGYTGSGDSVCKCCGRPF